MGCVSSANFAVLVNGSPSPFFSSSRGIRQGCPLSPLLFILVIEGLSLLIEDAKRNGKIKGIKISHHLSLTHLLFVDDVILFGLGILEEWLAYKAILDSFCEASGMCINVNKSSFLHNELSLDTIHSITDILPFKVDDIRKGFGYLG